MEPETRYLFIWPQIFQIEQIISQAGLNICPDFSVAANGNRKMD